MEWCGENGIPFSIVFTKSDKLKGEKAIEKQVFEYQKIFRNLEELLNIM